MHTPLAHTTPLAPPFSRLVRERSAHSHGASEGAGFMGALLSGDATRDDYVALVQQHYVIYSALEEAAESLREDPEVAPFLSPALTRLPSLIADLEFLMGPAWAESLEVLPVTAQYAARIREVSQDWPGGYVAHHYTRYLGDLSGGIHIGRTIRRRFDLDTHGASFYVFTAIDNPREFKDAYRAHLDAVPWNAAERERVIDEVLRAYAFNTELFVALEARRVTA